MAYPLLPAFQALLLISIGWLLDKLSIVFESALVTTTLSMIFSPLLLDLAVNWSCADNWSVLLMTDWKVVISLWIDSRQQFTKSIIFDSLWKCEPIQRILCFPSLDKTPWTFPWYCCLKGDDLIDSVIIYHDLLNILYILLISFQP